jgi:type IV pilus assembly protein PilC
MNSGMMCDLVQTCNRSISMKEKEVARFTRQLASALEAGLPIVTAVRFMQADCSPSSRPLFAQIICDLEAGQPLSATLRKDPQRSFDLAYCHLVEAGEYSGTLGRVLKGLADDKERLLVLKSRIYATLYYPGFILTFAWVLIIFTTFLKSRLPGILDFLAVAIPPICVWRFRVAWKIPTFRAWLDRVFLDLPILGTLVHESALARWSRTLARLYATGVPLIKALELVPGTTGNHVYDEASARIHNMLEGGSTLADAVRKTPLFSRDAVQMIVAGETSGTLDTVLEKLADQLETGVTHMLSALTPFLSLAATLITGLIVGFLVVPRLLH